MTTVGARSIDGRYSFRQLLREWRLSLDSTCFSCEESTNRWHPWRDVIFQVDLCQVDRRTTKWCQVIGIVEHCCGIPMPTGQANLRKRLQDQEAQLAREENLDPAGQTEPTVVGGLVIRLFAEALLWLDTCLSNHIF